VAANQASRESWQNGVSLRCQNKGARGTKIFLTKKEAPEHAAALLAESNDNDLLAFQAHGLFTGLCVTEIKALEWRDADLVGGFIQLGGFQKFVPADWCQFSKTCEHGPFSSRT
jgi:hypothetical protein